MKRKMILAVLAVALSACGPVDRYKLVIDTAQNRVYRIDTASGVTWERDHSSVGGKWSAIESE
jgi:hypothetical protein